MTKKDKKVHNKAHNEQLPENFKPFIKASENLPELTVKAVIIGIFLCVIMTASNAYLGMKAGMTVSASIPAAVISMSIFYAIRKLGFKTSILENNIVQTITSAGESLAAGVIFTVVGVIYLGKDIDIMSTTLVALFGGILGVLFMIPMRHYLVVKEHDSLPYPEGTACADVLKTGDKGGYGAILIFIALFFGFIYTWLYKGFKCFKEAFEYGISLGVKKGFVFGGEFSPALVGVGYIIGPRISALVFGGGLLSWLVIIPVMIFRGYGEEEATLINQAYFIWDKYIRYIGAGTMLIGGMWTLIQMRHTITSSVSSIVKGLKGDIKGGSRLTSDIPIGKVVTGIVVCIILIAIIPNIQVGFLGSIISVIAAFLFVAVSAYLVGVVGSSSNPISGMTLATILVAALIMRYGGVTDPTVVLMTAAVVCIAAATAGDTAQDLKTGFLLGATPRKQQYAQLIGVVVSALIIGIVIVALHKAYGIGPGGELLAPQAGMMAEISKGVLTGVAKWDFIGIGAAIALILIALKVPVLPFAVGLYLPVTLGTPIMLGGFLKWIMDRIFKKGTKKEKVSNRGRIVAAGLIAGEALAGVVLAGFLLNDKLEKILSRFVVQLSEPAMTTLGVLALISLTGFIVFFSTFDPEKNR